MYYQIAAIEDVLEEIGATGLPMSSYRPASCSGLQGIPILKNRAMTREESLKGLIDVRLEKASLAGNIVNAQTIHEAQNGAVEAS